LRIGRWALELGLSGVRVLEVGCVSGIAGPVATGHNSDAADI
jgi:hypothetical protein